MFYTTKHSLTTGEVLFTQRSIRATVCELQPQTHIAVTHKYAILYDSGCYSLPIYDATTTQPLILASSFPPVPARLAGKIRAGGYIDMNELMPDNISLLQALEAMHLATS